ncbi:MAG: tRNA 2-thiocytidine biosynthesis TtcA family protein [Campylobacterales bacterium]
MSVTLSKKLLKTIGKTNYEYELIKDGDKVLLGLSGGKDSLNLAHVLKHLSSCSPFSFEWEAVTIVYGMGEDYLELVRHCEENDLPHKIVDTNIYQTAQEKIRENSSFCSFFSRMRRGALYTYALENGFNKVALGHHLDDAAESFFMNLFYNGSLRTMPPIYRAYNDLLVIRPMIKVRERALRDSAIKNMMPTYGDEMCPGMNFEAKMPHAREEMKKLLASLEEEHKDMFTYMQKAFSNIHDDSFFDKKRLSY